MRNARRSTKSLFGKRWLHTVVLAVTLGWGIAPLFAADLVEDTALAVQNGDTATMKKLLAKGIDPNTTDEKGNPLLNLAAANGDEASSGSRANTSRHAPRSRPAASARASAPSSTQLPRPTL